LQKRDHFFKKDRRKVNIFLIREILTITCWLTIR
jgi:preprotein translocase subunit Sec63